MLAKSFTDVVKTSKRYHKFKVKFLKPTYTEFFSEIQKCFLTDRFTGRSKVKRRGLLEDN